MIWLKENARNEAYRYTCLTNIQLHLKTISVIQPVQSKFN